MVGPIHYEFDTGRDLTEPANDKLVAVPVVVVRYVAFKIRVRYIGKLTDYDIRILDRRLDIYLGFISCNWMYRIWIKK